jgi:hypothetical protein
MFSSAIRKFSREALARQLARPKPFPLTNFQRIFPVAAGRTLHLRCLPPFTKTQPLSTFQSCRFYESTRLDPKLPRTKLLKVSDPEEQTLEVSESGSFGIVKWNLAFIVLYVLATKVTLDLWTEDCESSDECQIPRCSSHEVGHYIGRLPPCLI